MKTETVKYEVSYLFEGLWLFLDSSKDLELAREIAKNCRFGTLCKTRIIKSTETREEVF